MKKYQIRPATAQDIPALQSLSRLEENCHRNLYPEYFRESNELVPAEELGREIAERNCLYLVALENERVIGFVFVKIEVFSTEPQFKTIEYALIEDCAVLEEYRRQGVAKALLIAARDWATDKGITRIQLQVWAKNIAAMQLYRRMGFQDLIVRMELVEKQISLE